MCTQWIWPSETLCQSTRSTFIIFEIVYIYTYVYIYIYIYTYIYIYIHMYIYEGSGTWGMRGREGGGGHLGVGTT